jgi:hypothetical protein
VENNLVVDDMQKVSSAYTKDVNPVEFIKNSFVVYVDKKRIHSWLNVNRLQLPLHSFNSDSTNSIAQKTKVVNTQNSLKSPSPKIQDLNRELENVKNGKASAEDALSKYVKDGTITTELYNELLESYGAIPEGENAHRTVKVPQRTAKDKKVSQTVRTILEAQATPDTAVPTIEKMVEDGVFSYDVYTDKQAISDAAIHL